MGAWWRTRCVVVASLTALALAAVPGFAAESRDSQLYAAARKGDVRAVERLLRRGADASYKTAKSWRTPLHTAAFNGHAGVVVLLLAAGARTGVRDAKGKTPLDEARANGNREVAAVLEGRTGS